MLSFVRSQLTNNLTKLANLGKSIVGNDLDDKWTDFEVAVKAYDQVILDLVAVEITSISSIFIMC